MDKAREMMPILTKEPSQMKAMTIGVLVVILLPGYSLAGEISKPGTAIEVENYRCVTTSERTIRCQNIGRVCVAFRAQEKIRDDKEFGCATKTPQTCEPWSETTKHINETLNLSMSCSSMLFGFGE